eukprot:590492-Amphidinium_carterae.1
MTSWLTQVFTLLDGFVTANVPQLVKSEEEEEEEDDADASEETKAEKSTSADGKEKEYIQVRVHGRMALEALWSKIDPKTATPEQWKPFGIWRHLLSDTMKVEVDEASRASLGKAVD